MLLDTFGYYKFSKKKREKKIDVFFGFHYHQ